MKYLDAFTSGLLADKLALLGYQQLAEDLEDITEEISFDDALKHLEANKCMLDDADDWTAYQKAKHEIILAYRYTHSTENLLYNSGGDCMWSLFRNNDKIDIFYHDLNRWEHLNNQNMTLKEYAENYQHTERWDLTGQYCNGDEYAESFDSIFELTQAMESIYKAWSDLESIDHDPGDIIHPYTLKMIFIHQQ